MEKNKSSSQKTLSKLFQGLSEWRETRKTKRRDPLKFNWSQFHLSIVHGYVLKLNLGPDSNLLSLAKLFEEECISLFGGFAIPDDKVASFMHELKEVLVVPEQHQLFESKKSVLVAAFIDMLLRLLHNKPGSMNSMEGRMESLRKELRFLLAVLGDQSFILNEHGQAHDLLDEFEAVANKAGSLVHLIFFSAKADPASTAMDESFGHLLARIDQLKDKIIEFNVNPNQGVNEANMTIKTAGVDSLFIVHSLLHDLEDLLNREDGVFADVKDQIKTLQGELESLNSLIKKVSGHAEMEELKEYVMLIRDVAYEAEYLINSFLVGDGSCRYFSIRVSRVICKIKSISSFLVGGARCRNFPISLPDVICKIKSISSFLVGGARCRNFPISLPDVVTAENIQGASSIAQHSLPNTRNTDVEDIIVGFKDKEEGILHYLEDGEKTLKCVSIHGMPGVGKTTLAKKLYNHPSLKYRYDKCSWCVVSQKYNRKSMLINILVGLKGEHDKEDMLNVEEENLVVVIHQSLKNRRYLIVLDDIWSSDAWNALQTCFPDDGNESRILFTTRNKDVAPRNAITYELHPMSDDDCWELLEKKVFCNKPCSPELKKIGKKIARNCRGVPLVVVLAVGILSRVGNEESAWEEVERNLASYIITDENSSITQIVELSYDKLLDHLKPCFLYFAAFPEDERILVPELLRLWIVEGFVREEGGRTQESLAEEYLMELIDKSLVTVAERRLDGGIKACVVHDLLHQFCLKRCEEENLHTVVDKNCSINEKHKRLRIRGFVRSPRSPLFGLHVRSILGCFPKSGFLNMKLLRVLDLMGIVCHGSLNEIKVLVNLRYLAIGYGAASQETEELKLAFISSLVNLEFLIVKSQFYLVYIPSVMAKMMKLRHINIKTKVQFGENCNISESNSLEFLAKVRISSLKDEEMLRSSPRLRRLKCKCQPLPVEENGEGHRYPDFSFFTELESLRMEADFDSRVSDISLPSNINKLTLYGLRMPWEKMSLIGRLQNLRALKLLSGLDGGIWETRDDEFQQLEFLKLKSVYDLEEWKVADSGHFPKLRGLILDDCHNLQEFPHEIGEIATLQLVEIKGYCKETLKESAQQIEQEQKEEGNEELKFDFSKIVGNTSETTCSLFQSLLD